MRSASEWMNKWQAEWTYMSIRESDIAAIQADALRHAAAFVDRFTATDGTVIGDRLRDEADRLAPKEES